MALEATERWEVDGGLIKSTAGWTAAREWDVVGATNETQALSAPGIPSTSDTHPQSNRLRVGSVGVTQKLGPDFYRVRADYNESQGAGGGGGDNPLSVPLTLRWEFSSADVQVDRDINGNPIVNSARDGFNPPPTSRFMQLVLEVRRNEPFFDVRRAIDFQNRVNKAVFSIGGDLIAEPGQALILSINPDQAYDENTTFVTVVYTLELRVDGFNLRLKDQGFRAWGYKPGEAGGVSVPETKVEILDKNKNAVSTDVALNGRGIPLKASNYTLAIIDGEGPAATEIILQPKPQPNGPAGSEQEVLPEAVFLRYEIYEARDFSALGL